MRGGSDLYRHFDRSKPNANMMRRFGIIFDRTTAATRSSRLLRLEEEDRAVTEVEVYEVFRLFMCTTNVSH